MEQKMSKKKNTFFLSCYLKKSNAVKMYIINEKYTGMDLKSIPLRKDFQRT